jgi:hypothetical protein
MGTGTTRKKVEMGTLAAKKRSSGERIGTKAQLPFDKDVRHQTSKETMRTTRSARKQEEHGNTKKKKRRKQKAQEHGKTTATQLRAGRQHSSE